MLNELCIQGCSANQTGRTVTARLANRASDSPLGGCSGRLAFDLSGGVLSQFFSRTGGELAQPGFNCGLLLIIHVFKENAPAENAKAATRSHVEHFAFELAGAQTIADL